jgi:hypothetical protein
MKTCKNRSDFEGTLQKQGISAVFRTNSEGRIYGATFIDHENRAVFNGSRLGKEFSANVFNELFKATPISPISPNRPKKPALSEAKCPINPHQPSKPFPNENPLSSIIEETLGIFDLTPQGESYDELEFTRRMRKKKKRKTPISL